MDIRRAGKADWPDIIAIYNEAVALRVATADTQPVTVESKRIWLEGHEDERYPIFLKEIGSRVAGWYSITSYRQGRPAFARTAELSVYISADFRGNGLGSELVEHAIAECRRLGYRTLIAILLDVNHPSIGLLEKYGFAEWGRMPGIAEIDGDCHDHLYYGRHI